MDEFELITNYFQKLTKNNSSALNLSDDVFFDKKNKTVLSVDTYNEKIHYLNFKKPALLIKKIIRSSISDLICKGVNPKYIFISASGSTKHFNKKNLKLISKSINEEQKKYNIKLSGGDTTKSNLSSFTIVSLGLSEKIVKRGNVSVGDDIYVTGYLGDSFLGLELLKKKVSVNSNLKNYFVNKYFLPDLPISITKYLFNFARSSIDISDGLFDDLSKLINNKKIGYIINSNTIPISKKLKSYLKINNKNILNFVSKGDDYQVLFTSRKNKRNYIKNLSKRINLKITRIGSATNIKNQRIIIDGKNLRKPINYIGYSHKF
tara:strand:+ start:105 stop:1064 length:960 start_codon:yes stop_codon:yes gene_type:complete